MLAAPSLGALRIDLLGIRPFDLEFCCAVPSRPRNSVCLSLLNGGKVGGTGATRCLSTYIN